MTADLDLDELEEFRCLRPCDTTPPPSPPLIFLIQKYVTLHPPYEQEVVFLLAPLAQIYGYCRDPM